MDAHDTSEIERRKAADASRASITELRALLRAEPDGPFAAGYQAQIDAWTAARAAEKEAELAQQRQQARTDADTFAKAHGLDTELVLRLTAEDRAEIAARAAVQAAPVEEV